MSRAPRRALARRREPRQQTAFVLSGGASLGAFQVGMVQARAAAQDLLDADAAQGELAARRA